MYGEWNLRDRIDDLLEEIRDNRFDADGGQMSLKFIRNVFELAFEEFDWDSGHEEGSSAPEGMSVADAHNLAASTVPDFSWWHEVDLEKFIAGVSDDLRGPGIPDGERIAMHEDRKAARAELARRHP